VADPINAALVRSILEKWRSFEWTIQGFGFARTKIQSVGRIHVWDSRLATPLVSTMHTHPWPLRSTVISGEIVNHRFAEATDGGMPYLRSLIATGEGGGLVGEAQSVCIVSRSVEPLASGESYEQHPDEIHRTIAESGTVTLIERPQGPPLEEALVYWPRGTSWFSAEPRTVEQWELEPVIGYALARWQESARG
jgi:hypothetical protein